MNRTACLLLSVLACTIVFADIKSDPSGAPKLNPRRVVFERLIYSNAQKDELPFALFKPKLKKNERFPLVVCLHGGGRRVSTNGEQIDELAIRLVPDDWQNKQPCFVLSPLGKDGWNGAQWRQMGQKNMPAEPEAAAMRLTLELIDELIRTHPIDPSRIYVTGGVMGGAGALSAAAHRPELFAAVFAVDPEMYRDGAGALKDMPITVATDPASNKTGRPQEIVKEITDAGNAKVVLVEARDPGEKNKDIEWLFKQRRAKPAKP
ncbi:MAG: alpha/beta hydrolase-fold protein [Phycisphaerae bacterium]